MEKHNQRADFWDRLRAGFTPAKVCWILLGAAIASFGMYNIHRQVHITEGGVLGLMLLVNHWLGIPSSKVTPVLDLACYLLAFRYLGMRFIKISIVSTLRRFGILFPVGTVPANAAGSFADAAPGGVAGRMFCGHRCGAHCASGRLQRRGRCPGAGDFPQDWLAIVQIIPCDGSDGPGAFPELYPTSADSIFSGNGYGFFLAD